DIYELLMLPLVAPPALLDLGGLTPGSPEFQAWVGRLFYIPALFGGIFGLLGGYLTDRFGRRQVLMWSILLYAFSAVAAGFSTSLEMLLFFRCTTFIGVCVEFVAAVAWLAELFSNSVQKEKVLGYTQAFSSVGGLLVTGAWYLSNHFATQLPAIYGDHDAWRYALISGVLPALPLIIIRPFLPESPAWKQKKEAGTLRRPSIAELFQPAFRRTTIVTTIMMACSYGAAFGAIQHMPRIVPGMPEVTKASGQALVQSIPTLSSIPGPERPKVFPKLLEASRGKKEGLPDRVRAIPAIAAMSVEDQEAIISALPAASREASERREKTISGVGFFQEIGGLVGRFLLAMLAVVIVSRRTLLRIFQVPGLLIVPLVFYFPGRDNLELFKWGFFIAGMLTVAQFSFWGNYLPRVYPVHLRGTGESFAANIGGRMIGTSAALLTTTLVPHMPGDRAPAQLAVAAAGVALLVYTLGFIASFWLPEPKLTDDDE
ncbi:MAG: MFS transporter, partial [Actinomycetota bacterium]